MSRHGWTPLHVSAFSGSAELVASHIAAGASDLEAVGSRGETPLHLAVMSGSTPTLQALLAAGASVRSRDNVTGATPLHLAAGQNAAPAAALLLAHGAHIDALDRRGFAPLQAALAADSAAAEQVLRDAGAIEPKLRFLDRAGLHAIMRSRIPAIVQLTTYTDVCEAGSARCELEEMWRDVAEGGDVSAWRSVCLEALRYRVPCAHLLGGTVGWQEMRAEGHAIRLWNGTAFVKWKGEKRRRDLEAHLHGLRGELAARADRPAKPETPAAMTAVPIPRTWRPTVGEFRRAHHERSIPAVIGGATSSWPASAWGLGGFVAACGHMPVATGVCAPTVAKRTPLSVENLLGDEDVWGGRATYAAAFFNVSTMGELVARQRSGEAIYFFDMSVEQACPALRDATRAPAYFPTDYQQQSFKPVGGMPSLREQKRGCVPNGDVSSEPSRHPSLFVFANDTRTALHADSGGTAFWMVVLAGRKRFRLFNASHAGCLYPSDGHGDADGSSGEYAHTFSTDAFEPDFGRHPRAAECVAWEGDVGPGEIIYIPARWPHAVWNLEGGVALSYNFVGDVELPGVLRYHEARLRHIDNDGFASTAAKHRAVAREAIAHVEAWLAGDEVEADAPLVASALWIAAFGSGVLPLRATVEDATDPSWDDFLKGNRMEHAIDGGWGAAAARRIAKALVAKLGEEGALDVAELLRRREAAGGRGVRDEL